MSKHVVQLSRIGVCLLHTDSNNCGELQTH